MRTAVIATRWLQRFAGPVGLVAVLVAACGTSTAPSAASSAAVAPVPSTATASMAAATASAIPDGRYASAKRQVADILARLEKDTTLSTSEKKAVIDEIFDIRGAKNYRIFVDVRSGNQFILSQQVDDQQPSQEVPWTLTPVDARTIILRIPCCGATVYEVKWADKSFTMTALSPASSTVETFVRPIIFEDGPFTREP
ncbi:MAG TPA: hypothetical protein VFY18_03725 [Candidatus Limnocylindrales bacterium]|nr:hypothetical protein [Candidatus Limnocylindrales bacterium]